MYVSESRGDAYCHAHSYRSTERLAIAVLVGIGKCAAWDPFAHDHDVLGSRHDVKDSDERPSLKTGRIPRSISHSCGTRVICGNDGDRNRTTKRGIFPTPQGHSLGARHKMLKGIAPRMKRDG